MTALYWGVMVCLLARAVVEAQLSGDNVCHRRETYTVTMRVLVKEPVQVKSYTWCLKVPPRCTKYKVEMRDKYKIQTELKERVVDICCAGYAPDRTESHCLPVCSGCLHGVCATPDTCTCEPGYTGHRCDKECEEGLWGPECKEECLCKNAADCHHVTGDCKCRDGWRGLYCEVPCPRGTYGHACLKECDCGPGQNFPCHHITGSCGSSDGSLDALPTSSILTATTVPPYPTGSYPYATTNHFTSVFTTNSPQEMFETDSLETTTRTLIHQEDSGLDHPDGIHTVQNSSESTTGNMVPTEKTPLTIADINTVLPTRTSVSNTLPSTEKQTLINERESTNSDASITFRTEPTITTLNTKQIEQTTITPNEVLHNAVENNSPSNTPSEENNKHSSANDNSDKGFSPSDEDNRVQTTKSVNHVETTKPEVSSTEPQNIQFPPSGVIVVSDGLKSQREADNSVAGGKETKSGVMDLVSSVSVGLGVALILIAMAVIILMVAHRRNKTNVDFAKRQQTQQQTTTPGPQMYNYTEDVTTLPLRHLFPDMTFQPSYDTPRPDSLQLRFGDVSVAESTPANNNVSPSFQTYHDMRAYLDLQYDIPPPSVSSKSNSLLPGNEPEHLYDEIPCCRSPATTSTNTDTDTSHC